MTLPRTLIGGLLVLQMACAPLPGLEAGRRIAPSDQPVVLLPLDEVLAQAGSSVTSPESAAALAARAAALRARTTGN